MRYKVLVADDDLVTRKVLVKYLMGKGLDVIQASDGFRARAVLEDNPDIRLLISDVLMPVIDGRELISGLRRDKRFDGLQVLVMSATVGVGEIRKLLEMGASRFLAKPINLEKLGQELEAMMT